MSHECCDPYVCGGVPPVAGMAGYGMPPYGAPGYGGFGYGGWWIWVIVIIAIFFLFFNDRRRPVDVV